MTSLYRHPYIRMSSMWGVALCLWKLQQPTNFHTIFNQLQYLILSNAKSNWPVSDDVCLNVSFSSWWTNHMVDKCSIFTWLRRSTKTLHRVTGLLCTNFSASFVIANKNCIISHQLCIAFVSSSTGLNMNCRSS